MSTPEFAEASLPHLDKEIFRNPEALLIWRQIASWLIVSQLEEGVGTEAPREWIKTTAVEKGEVKEGILFEEEIDLIEKHQLVYPTVWNEERAKISVPDRKYDSLIGLFDVSIPAMAEKGYVVGMTSGVFDILHAGHLLFLRECKRQCDVLVVGVDENGIVTVVKGEERPYNDFSIRTGTLSGMDEVDILCRIPELVLTQSPEFIPYMTLFYDLDDETLEKYMQKKTFAQHNAPGWYNEIGPNLRFFIQQGDPATKLKVKGAEYMGGEAIIIPKQANVSTTKIAEHFDLQTSSFKPNRFGKDPRWVSIQ